MQKPTTSSPVEAQRPLEEGFYFLRPDKADFLRRDKNEIPCVIRKAVSMGGKSGVAVFELEDGGIGEDISRYDRNRLRKMSDKDIVSTRERFIKRYDDLVGLSCASNEDVSYQIKELRDAIESFDCYMHSFKKDYLLPPIRVTFESEDGAEVRTLIIPRGRPPL
jgi:hypothetical protein